MRVLVAGELNVDLVLGGYNSFPELGKEVLAGSMSLTLGSSSAICACALATLGLPVTFIGRAGCDMWGDIAIARLRELGVDVSPILRDPAVPTGITVSISSQTDRAMVTYLGSIETLRPDDIDLPAFAAQGVTHLHVSSYYLQRGLRPGLRGLFAQAHASGMTTSLDPGCDPAGAWDRERIGELLPEVDVFFPNGEELRALANSAGQPPEQAVHALAAARIVAAKLGRDGAVGCERGVVVLQPAFSITPVDTTGAGDSFNAGFLSSWLRHGDLREALRAGAACGALSTRAIGGTAALPTPRELSEFLAAQEARTAAH